MNINISENMASFGILTIVILCNKKKCSKKLNFYLNLEDVIISLQEKNVVTFYSNT